MNAPVFTQDNLLSTVITPLGDNQLLFKSLQGQEYLSELFHFNVEMLSERKDLDFDKIVGKPLTVKIQFAPDHLRYINGIVTRFTQAGADARFTIYHAEIRPWFWLLTLTKNSQIFQNLSVPEIIKQVFDSLGFTDYRDALVHGHEKRVYCVQYEETAFNFVSRLMEDEGIFYFFEHTEDQHFLVLADDLSAHPACPGIPTARFWTQNTQEMTQPEDVVTACDLVGQVITSKYAVDDFNFETPAADLETSSSGTGSSMRIYEYSAGFEKIGQGEKKARSRLEVYTANAKLIEGQGHCFSFIPGYQFTLTRHPRDNLNAKYVLRWVSHSLSLTHYSNSFQAAPLEVPFRPPLTTPKPRIVSTQTAIVTGPAGEEIWTDKYGRIKVQFHWDQEGKYDENSSCWIRVNQGWAGKGWGHIAIPRIGQEVIVSFLEGDPDRPLVTGAVYNAQQTVPYGLPGDQTKSTLKSNSSKGGAPTSNYNELRFEDKKGQEEVYLQGEKDWNILIKHDKGQKVGHDETLSVGNNRTKTVGVDQSETIGSNKTIKVGINHTETIGSNMMLTVGANKTETVTIASAETVGAAKTLTIGAGYIISVGAGMVVTVGAGVNETFAGSQSVNVGGSQSVDIASSKTETAGTSHTTKAKTILIDAEDQIVLQAGKASITLKKNGDILISGDGKIVTNAKKDILTTSKKKINIKADNNIIIKGKKILEN